MRIHTVCTSFLAAALWAVTSAAADITVAVAANFAEPLQVVASRFEQRTGHTVTPIVASTGALYAQIVNGAPYDLFLAADVEHPERLEDAGLVVQGTRRTYAIGRLALWSADPELVDPVGAILASPSYRHLAIANPKLAPYGRAAEEVLRKKNLWSTVAQRIVYGENVAQVFSFVGSGNADLGFISASQVHHLDETIAGSLWRVPAGLHEPIEQQVVLLDDTPPARSFLDFLSDPDARVVIQSFGYDTPE